MLVRRTSTLLIIFEISRNFRCTRESARRFKIELKIVCQSFAPLTDPHYPPPRPPFPIMHNIKFKTTLMLVWSFQFKFSISNLTLKAKMFEMKWNKSKPSLSCAFTTIFAWNCNLSKRLEGEASAGFPLDSSLSFFFHLNPKELIVVASSNFADDPFSPFSEPSQDKGTAHATFFILSLF